MKVEKKIRVRRGKRRQLVVEHGSYLEIKIPESSKFTNPKLGDLDITVEDDGSIRINAIEIISIEPRAANSIIIKRGV